MTTGRARTVADESLVDAVIALARATRGYEAAGDTRQSGDLAAFKELLLDVANGWYVHK
jgi:hypothetical protein